MIELTRTIKYEADRVKGFGHDVMKVPGCENLESCIQCGTCSGVCPLSIYMDYSPRQVMALTRSDFKNEVLRSHTIWLCASCYACTVECPRQIRITDIMYELKQRAIQEGIYPKRFPIPVLAKEFSHMAHSWGRVTENWLVMRLFLKTNWLAIFKMWKLGLGLIRSGRFSVRPDKIKRRRELQKMMEMVDNVALSALPPALANNNNNHSNSKGNGQH
ncbi:MAG: 4Fe-4S dicluster domain-containing protein [Candidatus Omnitrophica bacterium]|nr:4Fe-4S dicluster domain-containing protein [Candidatus Omnitrophota bacterium]